MENVGFTWPTGKYPVLEGVQFSMARGERVFLRGPSGSGKTTLLSLIAAVLTPQVGTIVINGVQLETLQGGQRDQFRADHIGLVFQQFNLLPFLSVSDNIQLPCRFSRQRKLRARQSGLSLNEETDRFN